MADGFDTSPSLPQQPEGTHLFIAVLYSDIIAIYPCRDRLLGAFIQELRQSHVALAIPDFSIPQDDAWPTVTRHIGPNIAPISELVCQHWSRPINHPRRLWIIVRRTPFLGIKLQLEPVDWLVHLQLSCWLWRRYFSRRRDRAAGCDTYTNEPECEPRRWSLKCICRWSRHHFSLACRPPNARASAAWRVSRGRPARRRVGEPRPTLTWGPE